MKSLAFSLILFLFCWPLRGQANQIVETFSSRDNFESGTAIWNQALGKIHPSLQLVDYKGVGMTLPFSVGDGSDGAFELASYARFSVNGDISGNKIRFDTNRFPILKVTSFHLAPGWILEPVGLNPLIIYSLSTVRIEGEIWCQGFDGGNASGATAGAGGAGRCGGKPGGHGGALGQNGENGTDLTVLVTGGQGGISGQISGGGGGGAWGAAPAGSGSSGNPIVLNTGALAGQSHSDAEFLTIAGGAGGGGGSGEASDAGGGGGGGGGVVILHAVGDVEIGTSGWIRATGGKGGDSTANSGSGGGGGGGSVQIFSGATINILNPAGNSSNASGGAGGSQGGTATAQGGDGRSWMASVSYNTTGTGSYTPSEDIPLTPGNNTVQFAPAAQTLTTKSLDLQSTLAKLDSLTLTPASSDFTVEFKGSADDFLMDETNWTADLASLSNKRFLKMKITVNSSTPFNPTMLDEVKLDFTAGTRRNFDFKNGGCGSISSGPQNPFHKLSSWILLILPLLLGLSIRHKRKLGFLRIK